MDEIRNLALFDFDGTLISGDSIKLYCRSRSKNILFYYFEYYGIGRILAYNRGKNLKFSLVKYFSKKRCQIEIKDLLDRRLFNDSKRIINNYKSQGIQVVIVSASFKEIIGDYVRDHLQCDLIANELNNIKIDINHTEKVNQVIKNYPNSIIEFAYGNSSGDIPMLCLANRSFWRHKDGTLKEWKS